MSGTLDPDPGSGPPGTAVVRIGGARTRSCCTGGRWPSSRRSCVVLLAAVCVAYLCVGESLRRARPRS